MPDFNEDEVKKIFGGFEKVRLIGSAIFYFCFRYFFASFPLKSDINYGVEWEGFNNCYGLQPKLPHPKHFCPYCT